MRYFHLVDDVAVPERWHLGEVLSDEGEEPMFLEGKPVGVQSPLRADVHESGRPLAFCLTSFAVPIASRALASAMMSVVGPDLQCVPVDVGRGDDSHFVLNVTRVFTCLDERRSRFVKWTASDHRADLAGQYREVSPLFIDPTRVPGNVHLFRVHGWPVLIVSETLKTSMERAGCLGAEFVDVSSPAS